MAEWTILSPLKQMTYESHKQGMRVENRCGGLGRWLIEHDARGVRGGGGAEHELPPCAVIVTLTGDDARTWPTWHMRGRRGDGTGLGHELSRDEGCIRWWAGGSGTDSRFDGRWDDGMVLIFLLLLFSSSSMTRNES